jgi:DNA-binding transcriptional regulator YhcF (GntR family)
MIAIDPDDSAPPSEQIRAQVLAAVRSGALAPGARLPTVRTLAAELGVAVNTVAKAYRELEKDEVVETRGRNGTTVSPHGDPGERLAQVAAEAYRARTEELGVDPTTALAIVTASLSGQQG